MYRFAVATRFYNGLKAHPGPLIYVLAGNVCDKNVFMNVTDAFPGVFYYYTCLAIALGFHCTIKSADDFIIN